MVFRDKSFVAALPSVHCCVYCGDHGQARDHYRPWVQFGEPYYLWSCHDCNRILQDSVQETLGARVRYILEKLCKRLDPDRVTEATLEETEGFLKDTLMEAFEAAELLDSRILWADLMATLADPILLEGFYLRSEDQEALSEAVKMLEKVVPTRRNRKPAAGPSAGTSLVKMKKVDK
jgi:hypothetical protein